jgi:hypothetical protein
MKSNPRIVVARNIFIALSLLMTLTFVYFYYHEVRDALAMDPVSYNCREDSMMMQLCKHPYTATIFWGILKLLAQAGLLVLAWIGSLLYLLVVRNRTKTQVSSEGTNNIPSE